MGILASAELDRWAMDPEALLVLTFDVGRNDPRLFDEVLDWVVVNGRLVSVQRLRNLAEHPDDRRVVEAVLSWAAKNRSTVRYTPPRGPKNVEPGEVELFGFGAESARLDEPMFLSFGIRRPRIELSRKSQSPELTLPINFAFRMRQFMGVGARAEVVRCLLTIDAPFVTTSVLAEATAYTRRNVTDSLSGLAAARVIRVREAGSERAYAVEREDWAALLGLERTGFPMFVEWPHLIRLLQRILRWLRDVERRDLSPYLLASSAREELEALDEEIKFLGLLVGQPSGHDPMVNWDAMERLTDAALERLEPSPPLVPPG